MIRQGPISQTIHGGIEYVAGVLFILAPFIFGFEASAAIAISIVVGVVVIVIAASTTGTTSLVNSIPVTVHVALDYVLAAVLIAAPFLFGFYDDDSGPTVFFIAVGLVHLLITIGTAFQRGPAEAAQRRS